MRKANQYASMLFLSLSLSTAKAQIQVTNERAINTLNTENYPSFYKKGILFQSATQIAAKGNSGKSNLIATTILHAPYQASGRLEKPVPMFEELVSPFISGALCVEASGKFLYFTQANLTKKGKPKTGKDGNVHLKIYTAKWNESSQKWEDISELPFCDDDFDSAYPSVSADGKRLFFSSNRPSGKGGMDLYQSINMNGKWSDPVNLGPKINTPQDEVFPFLHPDRTLFFASQGHGSKGKLDIFATRKTEEGWFKPVRLPEPINSPDDDMGIIVQDDMLSGYFISSRQEGMGHEDIFGFNASTEIIDFSKESFEQAGSEPEKTNPVHTPTEQPTQMALPNAQSPQATSITVDKPKVLQNTAPPQATKPAPIPIEKSQNQLAENKPKTLPTEAERKLKPVVETEAKPRIPQTESKPIYTPPTNATIEVTELPKSQAIEPRKIVPITTETRVIQIPPKQVNEVVVLEKPKEEEKEKKIEPSHLIINPNEPVKTLPVDDGFEEPRLKRGIEQVFGTKTMAIGTRLELKHQFNYGAAELDEALKDELMPIIAWLKERPQVNIEIGSHTDSRGKSDFNEMLSQLRADNMRTYFVSEGIHLSRVAAKGYGESQVKNQCRDGVACTDDQHAENRRTEIKILKAN
jgi:outer membrane protein OmpA-like peptidoglycan-associated protein